MSTSDQPSDIATHHYDAQALARAQAALDEQPEQIGPYRVLERLGGGGMGEVYRAEQRTPIRREVALKLIKLGMDTKLVIARFEAERQALAMMDHPHIAKVYDAGAEETGRPYFVMEYVKGRPITQYADQNHLTIAERLELFEQVCHAIQHAHHKGVVHRDLKPSNILVSTQDSRPFAKVIDFGIAKATAQRLTDKTLYTQHEQLLGTPQYMSPEQAEGTLDIDTRTDVYSLGVLLYELLTGSTPFGGDDLKAAALEQMKRMVREIDPPKPSTRISMSGNTLPTLAASRRTEPKKLGLLVRGELDWIVMKSLEKDRARRYDTPATLAEDVQRYLTGQPVLAAPPSWGYRVRKYVRRRKGAVIAVAVIAVALIAGTITSTLLAIRANQAEQLALEEKAEVVQQKTEAQAQRDTAVAADRRSEAEAQRAHRMFSGMCIEKGLQLSNDSGLAMLWFAKALELDANDPQREPIQRKRLSTLILWNTYRPNNSPPGSLSLAAFDADVPASSRFSHFQEITAANFSADGKSIATSATHFARLWDADSGQPILPPLVRTDRRYLDDLKFSRDGKFIIANGAFFDAQTGQFSGPDLQDEPKPHPIAATADRRFVLARKEDSLGVYDGISGEKRALLADHVELPIISAAISEDGQYAGYADAKGQVYLWDVASRQLTCDVPSGYPIAQVRFSDDGRQFIVGGNDHSGYWVLDKQWSWINNGKWTNVQRHLGNNQTLSKLSPKTTRIKVLDSTSGKPISDFNDCVLDCLSPNCGKILVGDTLSFRIRDLVSNDSTFWSIKPYQTNVFTSATFSPDGRYLLTADKDSGDGSTSDEIKVWDAATGEGVTWYETPGSAISSIGFSPDGNRILIASGRQALVWDFRDLSQSPQQLTCLAELLSGRRLDDAGHEFPLTDDEREVRRKQLLAECPELFQRIPNESQFNADSARSAGISNHYRQAVEAQVAQAKTVDERKQLSISLAHEASIEGGSEYFDEAYFLAQTAVGLDDSNLDAQYQLAAADLRTNRFDEALSIFAKHKGEHYSLEWYFPADPSKKDVLFGSGVSGLVKSAKDNGHDSPILAKIKTLYAPAFDSAIDAHDVQKLNDSVSEQGTVKGTVLSVERGADKKGIVLVLARDPTFLLWIWNKDLPEIEKKFGGDLSTTLAGKPIAATGLISNNRSGNVSDIRIDLKDPAQINVISADQLVDFWDLLVVNSSLPKSDYEAICEKLEAAIASHAAENNFVNELGYVQYRLGQYAAAIDTLNRPDAIDPENQNLPPGQRRHLTDWAFLAMAYFQLGQKTEAEYFLDQFHRVYAAGDDPDKYRSKPLVTEADALVRPSDEPSKTSPSPPETQKTKTPAVDSDPKSEAK